MVTISLKINRNETVITVYDKQVIDVNVFVKMNDCEHRLGHKKPLTRHLIEYDCWPLKMNVCK